MKFTLSWLKDHLETEATLAEILDKLTVIGMEVEGVENKGQDLAPFTVARVTEAAPHPEADRLRVCRVETAEGEVQVVCGAPNARTGMIGVFAPSGTTIPGTGLKLKPTTIRGVESSGMLVSEREMGLSDEHEGIIELNPEQALAPPYGIGAPFARIMGLDDPVIEVAITPNRGDCLGVHGIARDLAAAGLGRLKTLRVPKIEGAFESPIKWIIDLPSDQQKACPYVAGRLFRGVENGPSPDWMQRRLQAIGLRPISRLVDITNYISYDLGRPLHVFDADKVRGHPTIRLSKPGGQFTTLEEKNLELDQQALVIADDRGAISLAGIMGGEETGCTHATTNVFLEVALFDASAIARAGRHYTIASDARYRFERHVDPKSADWGAEIAAQMILDLCGGTASELTSAGEIPDTSREISLRGSRVADLGGLDLPIKDQMEILERLGFSVTLDDSTDTPRLHCLVPSWRPYIEDEAGLVDEILRLYGMDRLPSVPLPRRENLPHPVLTVVQQRKALARSMLANTGGHEVVSFSFLKEKYARLFGWKDEALRLLNPISMDLEIMRPSVLPNLVEAAARNADRGYADLALFEVGPQYTGIAPQDQSLVAGLVRAGKTGPRHWKEKPRPVDVYDAKSDALAVLEACGAPVDNLQVTPDAPSWYHPGRSGSLRLGPKVLAWFGQIHPRVAKSMDIRGALVMTEVFLESIPAPRQKAGKQKPALVMHSLQPVDRDFAFIVEEDVSADKVVKAIRSADKNLITGIDVFDVFRGESVGEDKKSLAFSVTLQPQDQTFTDKDLEEISARIVEAVAKATGGYLRS